MTKEQYDIGKHGQYEHRLLSLDEQLSLGRKLKKGTPKEKEYARNELIMCNLKLASQSAYYFYAKWKQRSQNNPRLELRDFVQAAEMGLIEAVDRYNYKKRCAITTHATTWIRKELLWLVGDNLTSLYIPINVVSASYGVRETFEPDGTSKIKIKKNYRTKDENILKVARMPSGVGSIDAKLSEESDITLGEILPDKTIEIALDVAIKNDTREKIMKVLGTLDERTRRIIEKHHGLNGYREPWTLNMAGKSEKISRERARQLQEIAFKELRNNPILKELY
ncbi:MAG: sigma factor-like helix-turn-helix DNA-binding protein [Nanoarchaeota archaeon]